MNDDATPMVLEQKQVASGKWIALSELTYRDSSGVVRQWECVQRLRTQGAASIICRVEHKGEPYLVTVRQYRPPTGGAVIELPAGLLDDAETGIEAALRELEEETGWRGDVVSSGPFVFNSPGLASEKTAVFRVEGRECVDARPDHGEAIEVLLLPMRRLKQALLEHESAGQLIDAKLWCVAEGIDLGMKLSAAE